LIIPIPLSNDPGTLAKGASVTLLSRHREERKAAPAVVVERITEHCRWDVDHNRPCDWVRWGFKCSHRAEFICYKLGAKLAYVLCEKCIADAMMHMLERPAGESERLEAEKLARIREREAIKEARKAHDTAGLCEAWSRRDLSNLCPERPKFLVENSGSDLQRLCGRHAVRWRKRPVREWRNRLSFERPRRIEKLPIDSK
jgi:hypothetical protein